MIKNVLKHCRQPFKSWLKLAKMAQKCFCVIKATIKLLHERNYFAVMVTVMHFFSWISRSQVKYLKKKGLMPFFISLLLLFYDLKYPDSTKKQVV